MPPPRPRAPGVPIAQRGPGWSYRVDDRPPSVHRTHQPGIDTPRLDHLRLAAFDLCAPARDVLAAWTAETEALLANDLTVTVGLGAGAFGAAARPVALRALPPFPGDALDPAWSGGDLALQVCAARANDAADALRRLAAAAAGGAVGRWEQAGHLRRDPRDGPAATPRDPLGFRDGTHNLRRGRDLDRHVWIDRGDRARKPSDIGARTASGRPRTGGSPAGGLRCQRRCATVSWTGAGTAPWS